MKGGDARRACALAFLTAFATLSAQVLVHRMVSAKLVNNLAFLVLSLTMLGFAFSGVVLTRWRDRVLAAREDVFFASAAFFALTLILTSAAFYQAPSAEASVAAAEPRAAFLLRLLLCLPPALLYAVPFAFCGLILGALLAAPDLPTGRVYFFDLAGSAAGAFAVIPAISHLGVERSAAAAAAALLAGAWMLLRPRGRLRWLGAAGAVVVAVAALVPERVFQMRYPEHSFLGLTQIPGTGHVLEHVAWDPVARIEVSRITPPSPEHSPWPVLTGSHRGFLERFKRVVTQNNDAFTYAVEYDGRKESLDGIDQTLYAAAYQATSVPRPDALVIGVGGGFDILTAIRFDAAEITGVEVNGATLGLLHGAYRDYFRPMAEDPRVRLFHAEGRNFLAGQERRYDVIQLSGVDSASGTPGAAHVFSENYLYTAEAFDLYLSRLSDAGIMNLMRLEYAPPREMLRALVSAVDALRRAGVRRPADHVAMVSARNGLFSAMLVKKSPFAADEVARLSAWAAGSPYFFLAAAPGVRAEADTLYQRFLAADDPRRERAFVHAYPFDIRPVGDDRPFFFKYSYWGHLFPRVAVVKDSVPVMEYSVLVLLALTGIATVAGVYLPLRHLSKSHPTDASTRRFGLYFAAIALGYMGVEMALLQKFGLFLGHPNYALSVVLAALLLATGIGALVSGALMARAREPRFVAYGLAALVLALHSLVFPRLTELITLPFGVRVLVVFLLVMPVGVGLGVFFPVGLDRLKMSRPAFAPWAWGLNGMLSVVAPVLSVALSITWGINALLLSSVVVYLAAGWLLPAEKTAA